MTLDVLMFMKVEMVRYNLCYGLPIQNLIRIGSVVLDLTDEVQRMLWIHNSRTVRLNEKLGGF